MLSLEVHLVDLRRHQVVKVTWVRIDLKFVPLLGSQLEDPTAIELRDQMSTLGVVDAVLFPAGDNLAL